VTDAALEADDAARRHALVERLFLATVGTWDVLAVYIGDRLGTTGSSLSEARRPPVTSPLRPA